LVKAVDKDREAAFEKQDYSYQVLLAQQHYSEASIEDYLLNGLLPCLTRDSFRYNSSLLSAICQLAFDHPIWEEGPAKSMLDYHSYKLLQLPRHVMARKMHVLLRAYVYLQDASAKGFDHKSMTENLWDQVAQLTLKSQPPKIPTEEGGANLAPAPAPAPAEDNQY
jgi:hypothetical protein